MYSDAVSGKKIMCTLTGFVALSLAVIQGDLLGVKLRHLHFS